MKLRKLIIKEDHALVPLTWNQYAIIDLEDIERVGKYNWHAKKRLTYYAYRVACCGRDINNKQIREGILLHRYILDILDSEMQVDHRNGNGIDNRKRNLRICTNSENSRNRRKIGGVSKFKGIHWDRGHNKWHAQITTNKKVIHLGRFGSEIEAAKVYDVAALKYHKEFAATNEMLDLL